MNFSEYVNGLRMRRAKQLLTSLHLKIQEIASAVGYQNVNSFIRMFKRYSDTRRIPEKARPVQPVMPAG